MTAQAPIGGQADERRNMVRLQRRSVSDDALSALAQDPTETNALALNIAGDVVAGAMEYVECDLDDLPAAARSAVMADMERIADTLLSLSHDAYQHLCCTFGHGTRIDVTLDKR